MQFAEMGQRCWEGPSLLTDLLLPLLYKRKKKYRVRAESGEGPDLFLGKI